MSYEIEGGVRDSKTDSHGRHYYRMVSGQKRYIYKNVRQSPYTIATIDSMIDPQPHSAGTYPYGYCVTIDDGTLEIPLSGWSASSHSDHTYLLIGWAAANGIGVNEEITLYDSSGNYVTIGGGELFGALNNHLYIQVHSDAGVTANDAAAFMVYLTNNPITITDRLKTYQVNNYSGTSEAVGHADWDDLGAGISFTPVSTPADLNAVRANQTDRVFGTGTRWQAEYTTTGLSGHYIQVADIDLYTATRTGGAYNTGGRGWPPISVFAGMYDGGGRFIDDMRIDTNISNAGLFGQMGGTLKNIYISGTIKSTTFSIGLIAARPTNGFVYNCIAWGLVMSTISSGNVGVAFGYAPNSLLVNIISIGAAIGNNEVGGMLGTSNNTSILNTYSNSNVIGGARLGGLVGGSLGDITVTASYYNTETSGQSDTGKGVLKTTAELLAGTPSAGIYTDWDERIWDFSDPTIYPVHKFFGTLGISLPPPVLPVNKITEETDGGLTYYRINWDEPDKVPKGYNLYRSVDNLSWQKANDELITTNHYVLPNHAYGYLYNFYAIDPTTNGGKSLAPDGWHVPSDAEWTTLETFVGADANRKLKSRRTTIGATSVGVPTNEHPRWFYHADNFGTNESGFSALPGGYRFTDGSFLYLGGTGYWWSSTELSSAAAWRRGMNYNNGNVARHNNSKAYGFSLRCVRDNLTGYVDGERVTDADGNIYDTVKIGDQVWMLQNLVTTKYSDGTPISNNPDEWAALETGAYCAYNNDEANAKLDRPDGLHNYFVEAVYHNKVYKQDQSTGNSETTLTTII